MPRGRPPGRIVARSRRSRTGWRLSKGRASRVFPTFVLMWLPETLVLVFLPGLRGERLVFIR